MHGQLNRSIIKIKKQINECAFQAMRNQRTNSSMHRKGSVMVKLYEDFERRMREKQRIDDEKWKKIQQEQQ